MIKNVTSDDLLKEFYLFNVKHYKNNKFFIHPLEISLKNTFDVKKNPFWKTVFFQFLIFEKDHIQLGRIATIIPKNNPERATFGFFECINDLEVAQSLFTAAQSFAIEHGAKSFTGPFNPSLNYELGILTSGFSNFPNFMMTYNFDYYDLLIQNCGFKVDEKFYSYLLKPKDFIEHSKLINIIKHLKSKKNIEIRKIDLKNFKAEAHKILEIYNDAFASHYGFIPFYEDEFMYMAKDMVSIIDPDFFKIIYIDNEAVAFILALPNFNQVFGKMKNGKLFPFGLFKFLYFKKFIDSVRVINVAVKNRYKNLGLGSLLYHSIFEEMNRKQYKIGQLSWIAQDNMNMIKIVEELGATIENTYNVYKKEL